MFDYLWQGVLTIGSLVLGWLHLARRQEMTDVKGAISKTQTIVAKTADDLVAHKLYAAETFARRAEVKEAIQQSEERVKEALAGAEERLSKSHEKLAEKLDTLVDRLPAKH